MSETVQSISSRPPDQTQLESLVAATLDEAGSQGATACEAAVSFGSALSVTVRLGEVETLEYHRNRGLGVTVYFEQRKGSASTSDWRPEAIRETVYAACAIARHTAADPYAGLADPDRLARQVPDLDLYYPGISAPSRLSTSLVSARRRPSNTIPASAIPRVAASPLTAYRSSTATPMVSATAILPAAIPSVAR